MEELLSFFNPVKWLFRLGGKIGDHLLGSYERSSDLQSQLDAQSDINQFSVSTARELWNKQAEADRIAMNFSAQEASKLRSWQENMSNTANQRAVEDMRKAGLNPILALADAASTPSGASGSGVSSARQAAQLNLDNVTATFKNLLRSLDQSGENVKTAADAQKYAANVSAVSSFLGTLVNNGAFRSSSGKIGF